MKQTMNNIIMEDNVLKTQNRKKHIIFSILLSVCCCALIDHAYFGISTSFNLLTKSRN